MLLSVSKINYVQNWVLITFSAISYGGFLDFRLSFSFLILAIVVIVCDSNTSLRCRQELSSLPDDIIYVNIGSSVVFRLTFQHHRLFSLRCRAKLLWPISGFHIRLCYRPAVFDIFANA